MRGRGECPDPAAGYPAGVWVELASAPSPAPASSCTTSVSFSRGQAFYGYMTHRLAASKEATTSSFVGFCAAGGCRGFAAGMEVPPGKSSAARSRTEAAESGPAVLAAPSAARGLEGDLGWLCPPEPQFGGRVSPSITFNTSLRWPGARRSAASRSAAFSFAPETGSAASAAEGAPAIESLTSSSLSSL